MKHSDEFVAIVDEAKTRVREISVTEAIERAKTSAVLVDVREDNEWDEGHVKGAIHLARGIIERDIVARYPDKHAELILYCGGGSRSALAADMLQKMGYNNVYSMAGGWRALKENPAVEIE